MSITYPSYVSQISNIMVVSPTDPNFTTFLPGAIDYAEGRIYRDLDLLSVRAAALFNVSSGVQAVVISTAVAYFLVIEQVWVALPVTSSNPPTKIPLSITSLDYVTAVYPSFASSNCGTPQYAARITDSALFLGPVPDAPYQLEVYGTFRPSPLSSGNSSTWLTQNVPELFVAATMVFAAGYMRDYGAQSDDPRMSQSWEQQYQALLKSAVTDQLRSKYQSAAWSHWQPSPIATPPRV